MKRGLKVDIIDDYLEVDAMNGSMKRGLKGS